jgi:competence protein ComEC
MTSWSGQPLLIAAFFFSAGILYARLTNFHNWRPANWLLFAAMALLLGACYWLERRAIAGRIVVLLSLMMLGALTYELKTSTPTPAAPSDIFNVPVEITGHVVRSELPAVQSSTDASGWWNKSEGRQSLDFETEEITREASTRKVRLGVRLNVYSSFDSSDEESNETDSAGNLLEFRYGQRLKFPTRLREPRNFNNPGAWDYRGYLAQQGIIALASAKADEVKVEPGFTGTRWGRWRNEVRRSLVEHMLGLSSPDQKGTLARWFTISREDAGLLAAMILGDRSLLHRNTKADFQKTGSYHLLVVSGMNVAILAFAIFWLARRLHVGEVPATIVTILLSVIYASLTDLGAPIQRAVLMSSIYLGARLLYRDRQSLNAIGAAALAVLLFGPSALFDAGFQLTFLAVLTIAGIGIPILERSSGRFRKALYQLDSTSYDSRLQPAQAQFRLDLRMIAGRLRYFLPDPLPLPLLRMSCAFLIGAYDLIAMSFLMQAALALPMAIYFHRLTIMGLPTNVVVVPLMGMLMPVTIIATLLSYLGSWAALVPKMGAALVLHSISGTISLLAGVGAANIRVANPLFATGLACALAFALAMWAARRRRALLFSSLVLLFATSALLWRTPQPRLRSGLLEVTAIDVGQGDSILVVTPAGKTLLIDGGGSIGPSFSEFDFGEDVVSPYLWSREIAHLDAVALTHAHGDHIGGLPSVLANFHPDELWIAPSELTGPYLALIRQASANRIAVVRRIAGETFPFGGAGIEVLWPPADWQPTPRGRNAESMVLRISYSNSAVLLEGDAEKKTERQLAGLHPSAQLLKVGHHGSNTSTIPELLDAVKPKFAVISSGAQNTFGHPRPEVLERLARSGVHTYRTDRQGAVSFFFDGQGITSTVFGAQQTELQQNNRTGERK